VSGTLAASATVRGELTIGTSNDVIIDGNLNYTDCSTPNEWVGAAHETACNYRTDGKNDSLGLIANNYIEVDHPIDPRSSNHDTLLPTCGSAAANAVNPPLVAPLCQPIDGSQNITIDAAILALKESFGANNWASGPQLGNIIIYGSVQQEARGLITNGNSGFGKYYTWDPRLELASPPSYLDPSTSSYGLDSSAISPRVTCPTLYPVYAGAGTVPSVACPTVPAP
jgi:hypothetical protein